MEKQREPAYGISTTKNNSEKNYESKLKKNEFLKPSGIRHKEYR